MARTCIWGFHLNYTIEGKKTTCELDPRKTNPNRSPYEVFLSEQLDYFFQDFYNKNEFTAQNIKDSIMSNYKQSLKTALDSIGTKRGEAYCDPDDTFDVEVGKKLAYDRLVKKLLTARKIFINLCADQIFHRVNQLQKRAKKHYICLNQHLIPYYEVGVARHHVLTSPNIVNDNNRILDKAFHTSMFTKPIVPDKIKPVKETDAVNHPSHYNHGIECIDYIESHDFNFNLGNVIKYTTRAGFKNSKLEDLEKAKWYLEREIKKAEKETENG